MSVSRISSEGADQQGPTAAELSVTPADCRGGGAGTESNRWPEPADVHIAIFPPPALVCRLAQLIARLPGANPRALGRLSLIADLCDAHQWGDCTRGVVTPGSSPRQSAVVTPLRNSGKFAGAEVAS